MFVVCNRRGDIIAAHTNQQYLSQEPVPDDDRSLLAYLNRDALAQKLFGSTGLSVDDLASLSARTGKFVERAGISEQIISATDAPTRDFQERLPLDASELVAFTQQEPPEPEPKGFRYQSTAAGWRILSVSDGAVLVQGLPEREACVAFMRARANRLKQEDAARRAKWAADREAGWNA